MPTARTGATSATGKRGLSGDGTDRLLPRLFGHARALGGPGHGHGRHGGEYGIRGFIDAFDVETGERLWRFYTVPGPGEFGNGTWSGDSWKTGGASIWITPGYDPELNLVYWGVGNPRIRASASGTSGSPLTTSMTGTPRKSWC